MSKSPSSNRIRLPANGWRPRPYQRRLWEYLEDGGKRAVAIWHRRAGKDEIALHHASTQAFQRVASYWHMLPEAAQSRKAIWDAVDPHTARRRIDNAFPLDIRKGWRDSDMFIRFKSDATWQVVGSDNFASLIGSPPAGIVFSEWARANPMAWALLRPILAENNGWSVFITTPLGNNHAAQMYKDGLRDPAWFSERLTVDDTGLFSQAQLDAELREYKRDFGETQGEQLFQQEYYCSFEAAILGAYYGKEMADAAKRITSVPHFPGVPVETWWDLGTGDSTSIWFAQRVGQEIHLIDYHEENGKGLAHYAALLQAKQRENSWVYGDHVWPHDGGHEQLATGESLADTFRKMGFGTQVLEQTDVAPGIDVVRRTLPRCWFDAEKCERGIEALRNYRAEWDEDKKVFKPKPLHDWASHGADAFRYGCQHTPTNSWAKLIKYDNRGIV